jgi:imidazolonepropionase-like amidohydrolase
MMARVWSRTAVCAAGMTTFIARSGPAPVGALAIVDVNVVPMDRPLVLRHQTVIVRGGRIAWLGPAATAELPSGARVVQGNGRYLMPGLIDMHVHLRRADLPQYLASGITTVRNMWGHEEIRQLEREVAAGTVRGPTIFSASAGLDGTPPQWPGTVLVLDSASAGDAVRAQVAAGWSWIKVYTQLTPPAYHAIMAAARAAGVPVVGHVPLRVDIHDALASGQRSIEHLTGYDRAVSRTGRSGTWGWTDADTSRYAGLVAATVAAGTWNCPTLAIFVKLAEQHPAAERPGIIERRRQFVRALSRAGAHLLAGTDAGIGVVAPGTSLHDELAELVAAGLTPYRALRAATADAAAFLGRPELGWIGKGAAADLLLVAGNPLEDVGQAAKIEGMVLRGE